jgi:intracellular sulfur oxidation DsrE/DsrF family protein
MVNFVLTNNVQISKYKGKNHMKLSTEAINNSGLKSYLQSIYNLSETTTEVAVKVITLGAGIEETLAINNTKGIEVLKTVAYLLEKKLETEAVVDAALGITNNCKSHESTYTEHHSYAYDEIKSNPLVVA